jgi:rhamnogalacturonyl hydrolase YesR
LSSGCFNVEWSFQIARVEIVTFQNKFEVQESMNRESMVWQTLQRFGVLSGTALAVAVLAGGAGAKAPSHSHTAHSSSLHSSPSASMSIHSAPAMPAPSGYRLKAETETDYIQSHFYDPSVGRYHPSFPPKPGELPYDFMWGNGVQFTVMAAAAKADPAKYQAALYGFTQGLSGYWDSEAIIPGYEAYCSGPGSKDKYYDDNEWMVLGFIEAYQNTGDPKFLKMARSTQEFVLSGWDDVLGGGIYWKLDRQSKNTCSNAPAAAGALRLVQVAGDREQADWALRIRDWTQAKLQDKDGLYWDDIRLNGAIGQRKWSYNTALMIRTDVLLYQLRHTGLDLQEARRMADAGLAAWTDPATGSLQKTEDSPRFTHLFCESLLRLYDVTQDVRYLNAVRQQAAFGDKYARDPSGGYWDRWVTTPHRADETKSLIENASAARLLWLLSPYPDSQELTTSGRAAAGRGQEASAEGLLRQATDSDPNAVEARFYLWKVLTRAKKKPEAAAEASELTALAESPALAQRLKAAGWQP